jgi:tetratricopeptide (TPR) repeat protein
MLLRSMLLCSMAGIAFAVVLSVGMGPAMGQTATPDPRMQEVTDLDQAGKKQAALDLAVLHLAVTPNDASMLLAAARLCQQAGQIDQALVFAQRLLDLAAGSYVVHELMVQLYQAAGDLPKRDTALAELLAVQRNAIDPELRLRPFIVRDRIEVPKRSIIVQEVFETGGADQVKFVFVQLSEVQKPENYLVVRVDHALTDAWREAGILGPDKQVFSLVSVYRKGQASARTVYEVYAGPPDYDRVRTKALELLAGRAKPYSGAPGGLAVPAR